MTASNGSGPAPLDGQHAFVTGGGSGIGLGAARAFLADGATVTISGRTEEKLRAAVADLGDRARYVVADVDDDASISAALAEANGVAPLSIVVANAGTGGAGFLETTDVAEWERVLRTNLTGAFLTIKHGAVHLLANGGGAMCAVSSIAGSHTHRFMSPYVVSKGGLNALVRNAADELGSRGIRVNAVAPGLVETDISTFLQMTPEINEDYRLGMPLGRRGTTTDIGAAIRFLCGPESSWITGVVLPVDGGHHLRRGPNIDALLAGLGDVPPPSAEGSPVLEL
ncbi:MAG: SDR family NAD(P)-dependent oxidoreductase [Actinomycetota bacterium]|nr:SDR family NAD(P)-dependent oxidoreductase [Actinomycetota bacterium]